MSRLEEITAELFEFESLKDEHARVKQIRFEIEEKFGTLSKEMAVERNLTARQAEDIAALKTALENMTEKEAESRNLAADQTAAAAAAKEQMILNGKSEKLFLAHFLSFSLYIHFSPVY